MLPKLRDRLTYANVMATLAMFVALGGGAYALSTDSVKSKHIVDDQVKSKDVKDGDLTGEDVAPASLTGTELDEATLEPNFLPTVAGLATQIRNIGTGGGTTYGAPSGISEAAANMATVQHTGGGGSMDLEGMTVHVDTAPGSGESRTFSVVRRAVADSTILPTDVGCTLSEGERFCLDDSSDWSINTNVFAIEIVSIGAGLPAADEAYVGIGVSG